jgi:hypothetical protein
MSALSAGAEAGQEGCQAQADQAGCEGGHQGHQEEHQGVSRLDWAGRTATLCIPAKRQAIKLHVMLIITMPICTMQLYFHYHLSPRRLCILAGDISPIDVITPLPVLCEDNDIPYIFVPSKEELGQAGLTKRPTSCMLVLPKPIKAATADDEETKEFKESYDEVREVGGWVYTVPSCASIGLELGLGSLSIWCMMSLCGPTDKTYGRMLSCVCVCRSLRGSSQRK